MPLPLAAILGTAGAAGLAYLLFKPDMPANNSGGASGAGTLGENTRPSGGLGGLPPAKRPNDLPPPTPNLPVTPPPTPNVQPSPFPSPPIPIPIPSNVLPLPSPSPSPSPAPSPAPSPNVQPAPSPIPLPPMPPITPTPSTGVVIAPSGLNVRNIPSVIGSRVLGGMVAGTRVKINSYNPIPGPDAPKGWYNVTTPSGLSGWSAAHFINPDNGSNPNPVPIPIPVPDIPNVIPSNVLPAASGLQGRILGTPGANMRSAPNTSAPIVKGLYNGTIVNVLSSQLAPPTPGAPQGWVNVRDMTGASGWVSRQFCVPHGGSSFGRDPFTNSGGLNYRRNTGIRG